MIVCFFFEEGMYSNSSPSKQNAMHYIKYWKTSWFDVPSFMESFFVMIYCRGRLLFTTPIYVYIKGIMGTVHFGCILMEYTLFYFVIFSNNSNDIFVSWSKLLQLLHHSSYIAFFIIINRSRKSKKSFGLAQKNKPCDFYIDVAVGWMM